MQKTKVDHPHVHTKILLMANEIRLPAEEAFHCKQHQNMEDVY